jgi:pimeloyl-ACP methyl ester carboxylesterase
MPELASRFTVVAPDLLGHGASAKPHGEYSISGHANVIRDLLVALGIDSATIVGQSFGGGVAMQFAYQYPARCERLVLVSSGGLGLEVGAILRTLSVPGAEHVLALVCSGALLKGSDAVIGWMGRLGFRPGPVLDEIRCAWASLSEPETRRAFFRTLRAVVDQRGQSVSATDRLYLTAQMPTMLVWGGKDTLIPVSHAFAAHEAIPGSRLVVFENAGHFPHCEDPERFAETLIDFIAEHPPARVSETGLRDLLRTRAGSAAVAPPASA